MEASQLADQRGVSATLPRLTQLIDAVGENAFASSLFKSVFTLIRPDHLTAFAFPEGDGPRVVIAENAGPRPVALDIARRYREDYWRHDLANPATLSLGGRGRAGTWGIRTTASEIEHASYRAHCYTSVGLDDRISISETRNAHAVRLNFYRSRGNAFSTEEAGRIFESAKLLLALVRRHGQMIEARAPERADQYRSRLAAIAPFLSERELDVCACIVNGVTSEGIALALNVSINTVFTYRKRAYARLGISSQNELIKLALNGDPAACRSG